MMPNQSTFIQTILEKNINWVLRWMIIAGSIVRFFFSPPIIQEYFFFYLTYTLLVIYAAVLTDLDLKLLYRPKEIPSQETLQLRYRLEAIIDILFFSILYWLTGDPNSDFYLFYFLPLLFAAEKLNIRWAFSVFVFASAIITVIIFAISGTIPTQEVVLRIVFPRVVFFFFTSFIAASRSLHLRGRNQRRQEIRKATNKISKAITQEDLYHIIVEECYRMFEAVGVHLRIEKNGSLKIVASCGEYANLVPEQDIVVPKYGKELEAATSFVKSFVLNKPIIVRNARLDQHFIKLVKSLEPGEKRKFASTLKGFGCFPLQVDDRVIGVLTIRTSLVNYFTQSVEEDVQILMQNAAIAVRNLSSRDDLLYAAWRINQPKYLEARLEAIVNAASSILNGTGGKIYLLNKEKTKLTLAAIKGITGLNAPSVDDTLELNEGMVGQVVNTGEPQITDDYSTYQHAKDEFRNLFGGVIEIPLTDSLDNIIGAIAVINNNSDRIPYTEENDVPILEKFGQQASLAISNMHLLEREQLLHQLSNRISSTLDLDTITSDALASLKNVIYFDSASIQLKHGKYLDILDCIGFEDHQQIKELRFEMTERMVNTKVIDTRQYQIINDVTDEHPAISTTPGMRDVKHWLGMPLITKIEPAQTFTRKLIYNENDEAIGRNDEVIGMITFDRKLNHLPFTDEEVEDTLAFIDHIAIALKNVELYRISELYRQTIQVLYDVNEVVKNNFDLKTGLQRMAELAYELVQKTGHVKEGYSHITLVNGQTIFYLATHPESYLNRLKELGLIPVNWQEDRERYGIITRVCNTRKSEYVNDVENDQDFIRFLENDKSQISVPIILENTLLGVVSVLSPSKGFFTDDDITLLEFLAKNAAAVIKLSRLVGANIGLTAFSIPILHRLHANRKHIELARGYLSQQMGHPNNIVTQVNLALSELANIQLDFSDLPFSITGDMEPTDLVPLMENILNKHERSFNIPEENKTIINDGALAFTVNCNALWLTSSMNIILDNAVEAMENRLPNERQIEICFEAKDEGVEIQIRNNGQKFRYEVLQDVFHHPIHSRNQVNRVSLGALVAAQIIKTYNGTLDVMSTTDSSTVIAVWLPTVSA